MRATIFHPDGATETFSFADLNEFKKKAFGDNKIALRTMEINEQVMVVNDDQGNLPENPLATDMAYIAYAIYPHESIYGIAVMVSGVDADFFA